jgi:aminomethyltransferase
LTTTQVLKKTALHDIHRQIGARMVEFAGWDMPVQYAGPIPEHMAVRTAAGLFDVSHMGELEIRGPEAEANTQRLTPNDAGRLAVGQCQYSALTTPEGTFVDDVLVYRMAADRFFLCCNASNQTKDFDWIRTHVQGRVDVVDRSAEFTLLALQGPRAAEILQPLTSIALQDMKSYRFAIGAVAGVEAIVSRTGYTGEDGFELYFDPRHSEAVWSRLLEAGRAYGLQPAGLAARNTLRLEARLALYGNDIDETTTVLEADLAWICKFDKGDFIGREALLRQRESGPARKLVGFQMVDRGVARDHYPVEMDGRRVGQVTSGSPAPFLKSNIGLTYLRADSSAVGTELQVVIRGEPAKARVVPTPFYRRAGGSR